MSQMSALKREIQEAKKLHLPWRTRLLIFILAAPTTFLFALYGRLELALPLMISIGVLGFVIFFKRKLRHDRWFWVAMAVIALLHLCLILFVPWTTRWVPALAISVIASADFCLILWILHVVERLIAGPDSDEMPPQGMSR